MGNKKRKRKNSNYGGAPVETKTQSSSAGLNRKTVIILAAIALAVIAVIVAVVLLTRSNACDYAKTRDIEGHDITYVEMSVEDYGTITLLLDATTAPITVENFVKLANEGFYDGLTFHRVMEDFMIQGGDPDADDTGGSDETIKGEFDMNNHYNDISHIRGVISMARGDSYNSASSQFFICNADSTFLDKNYAAFGYVIDGMDVVDKITEKTAGYADSSGTISDKSKHAVIEYVKVLEN